MFWLGKEPPSVIGDMKVTHLLFELCVSFCVYWHVRIINPAFTCWVNLMLQFNLNFPQIGIVTGIQFWLVITTLELSTGPLSLNYDFHHDHDLLEGTYLLIIFNHFCTFELVCCFQKCSHFGFCKILFSFSQVCCQ